MLREDTALHQFEEGACQHKEQQTHKCHAPANEDLDCEVHPKTYEKEDRVR